MVVFNLRSFPPKRFQIYHPHPPINKQSVPLLIASKINIYTKIKYGIVGRLHPS